MVLGISMAMGGFTHQFFANTHKVGFKACWTICKFFFFFFVLSFVSSSMIIRVVFRIFLFESCLVDHFTSLYLSRSDLHDNPGNN